MSLPSELISQFVKVTNDSTDKVEETTVYGVIVEYNGTNYVRLDGSELLTPISATTNNKPGERVTVMIKNHTATVTGNLSSPSARSEDVEDIADEISDFEIVLAQKVDTEQLVAEQARIDTLIADDVTIKESLTAAEADIDILQTGQLTVTERLEAIEADIEELVVGNLDVSVLDAKYAKIEDLNATNVDVYNLISTYATFETTTTKRLTAAEGYIDSLQTDKLNANDASMTYAKIEDLDATIASVVSLRSEYAYIDKMMFGTATGGTLQTSFANAVIAKLGDAQIKSAMIESISASKIMAGDIITDNVRVKSQNGVLLISDETIQISDSVRVRVQIGKNAAGDYSINIWDADGNLMFSEGGITDSAIKDAIIRNDMVSDTANISAHKLDIDSLFEEINGSTNTIKSTQIYLDDQAQTLNIAFKELETELSDLGTTVSSQGTQLSVIQGEISSKVWQQDIDNATGEMSTRYSVLEQEVDGINTTVASHDVQIANKADSSTVTTVNNKLTSLETNLSGFKSTVSSTYAAKKDVALLTGDPTNYSCLNTDTAEQFGFTLGDDNWFSLNTVKRDTKISGLYECFGDEKILIEYEYSSNAQGVTTNGGSEIAYANIGVGIYCKKLSTGSDYSWLVTSGASATEDAPVTKISQIVTIPTAARYFTVNLRVDRWPAFTGSVKVRNIRVSKIDALASRVSNAETAITQNETEIALRAKTTDVTTAQLTADEAQIAATSAEERATSAEALIQILSESISMLVVDSNGESLMTQTDSGWTFSTSQIQSTIEETSNNLNELTQEVGDVNSTVNVLQQAVADLGEIAEYVKIGAYEGEPCIELGEGDSEFKLRITNTRILFMEGSSVIAHFTNQSLHIKKAVIEEELQQGEFVWKARTNGNLGLIWKGVTS